jgi:hypothetical protein
MPLTRGPLFQFMQTNRHRVLHIWQSRLSDEAWIQYRRDDGVTDVIVKYSRKRDAVRALRQAGYRQHGTSWSVPVASAGNPSTSPEPLEYQPATELAPEASWPFATDPDLLKSRE